MLVPSPHRDRPGALPRPSRQAPSVKGEMVLPPRWSGPVRGTSAPAGRVSFTDEDSGRVRAAEARWRREHGRFVSDAAHELRTPLAALRLRIEEALRYRGDIDPDEVLRDLLRDTARLEAVVVDLLYTARVSADGDDAMECVDLAELVAAMTACRRPRRPKSRVNLQDGIRVHGISSQLQRLISNLLDNAEFYARGTIEVELRRLDGQAFLSITDDGPGVPAGERDRVFECFARLDTARGRDGGGAGLGLTIARAIATRHGGGLSFEDRPSGTRITLRLPAVS